MAIEFNPSSIRPATGRPTNARRQPQTSSGTPAKPQDKAHLNYIPAPESLRTVIASALDALRRGVTWDRGSILNLLV